MGRFFSFEYHITLPVPHKFMITNIIQQNAFIETLNCSKSQISFEIENNSLPVIPCVIKKQIVYFQNIMVQIKHYHSERKKWGDSKEMLNRNKTGNQQNDTKSCRSCLMSKILDDCHLSCAAYSIHLYFGLVPHPKCPDFLNKWFKPLTYSIS